MLLVLLCPLPLLGITLVFSCGFAKKRMKIAVMFHTLHPESLCIERYHFLQSFIIAFSFQPQDDSNACIFFCKMRLCKFWNDCLLFLCSIKSCVFHFWLRFVLGVLEIKGCDFLKFGNACRPYVYALENCYVKILRWYQGGHLMCQLLQHWKGIRHFRVAVEGAVKILLEPNGLQLG